MTRAALDKNLVSAFEQLKIERTALVFKNKLMATASWQWNEETTSTSEREKRTLQGEAVRRRLSRGDNSNRVISLVDYRKLKKKSEFWHRPFQKISAKHDCGLPPKSD